MAVSKTDTAVSVCNPVKTQPSIAVSKINTAVSVYFPTDVWPDMAVSSYDIAVFPCIRIFQEKSTCIFNKIHTINIV